MSRCLLGALAATASLFPLASPALAQGAPVATGAGMPWQVAVMFTVNWVLAAVAVAILSQPSKRPEKPKKTVEEEA